MRSCFALFLVFTVGVGMAAGQDPLASVIRPTEPLTPAQQLTRFQLPEGFEIQLFASEPDIQKPMNLAFDARGRLWVTGSVEYPFAAEAGEGRDTIRVLEDADRDGRADSIKTFAEGLNIPIGLYPYLDGVVAYTIPDIVFFQDTDGDGHSDRRQVLYGQLGTPEDTHGMQNAFRRGFDGWLYVCHGFRNDSTIRGDDGSEIRLQSGNTYRVRLDGSRVEQFSWGQVNPFGAAFTPAGDLITADCHSKPLTMLLRGGYSSSFGKPHDGLGFVPSLLAHGHGSTAISGAAFCENPQFPPEYQGSLFVGNVMTSRVHRDSIEMHGSSLKAHEEEDFLICDDPWFRPVDLRFGPDGALYIADFYNRIIGHYEVPLDHPQRDRARARIWRVAYRGKNAGGQTASSNLSAASPGALLEALGSPSMQTRFLATDQLSDGRPDVTAESLRAARGDSDPRRRIHALWVLYRRGVLREQDATSAAADVDETVRVHAMRLLSEKADWSRKLSQAAVAGLADVSPLVRRAAADAVGQHPSAEYINPLLSCLHETAEHDVHLRHALRIALRNQLRVPEVFARVEDESLPERDRRVLSEVALAVPSSQAAGFIIRSLRAGLIQGNAIQPQLKHAARYVAAGELDDLVLLIREHVKHDVDLQLELVQALQLQLAQRGTRENDIIRQWGRELAARLLAETAQAVWLADSRHDPWDFEPRDCEDGRKQVRFLSSFPGGERATGRLSSRVFEIPERLSFFLCGHLGFPDKPADERNVVRLRLLDGDRVVRRAMPPRSDVAREVVWDLRDFAGQRGYVEIVDGIDIRAFAWLAVARFEPPVIAPQDVAPRVLIARQVAAAAIAGALRLAELKTPMRRLLIGTQTPREVRAACASALLQLQPNPVGLGMLPALRDATVAPTLQRRIAAALHGRDAGELLTALRDVLRVAPTSLQEAIAQQLVTTRPGGEVLLQLISEDVASRRLLQRAGIREPLERTSIPKVTQRVRQLLAGLPPLSRQVAVLIAARHQGFHQAKRSAERGRAVFAKHCAGCHQIGGKGALVGPQLDGIGNRGLVRVLEDVLDSNRNVDAAFHVSVIVTVDGRTLAGMFRRSEGATRVYVGNDGKEFSLAAAEIEEEHKARRSLMPDNIGSALKEPEFYDLMEFLVSLRVQPATEVISSDVFTSGKEGYHTYRIPSLVTAPDGSLLAICEGRKTSRADHGDVDLVLKRSTDGGVTWGKLELVHEEGGTAKITIGNPCPAVDHERDMIWLPFTRDNDTVALLSSADGGRTWSKPRDITTQVKRKNWTWYATGPGNGIQLTRGPWKGRLVIPCDHRVEEIKDRKQSTRSHVIYSDDHGATWKIGGITDFRMNECAVAELSDGRLMLNMRSNRGLSRRGVAWSDDAGLSWSESTDDEFLIEPVCQASLIRYSWQQDSRSRLLFSNPASTTARERMKLRVSYDEGATWTAEYLLHAGSAAYSSLSRLPDGRIGVLYERDGYSKINFSAVPIELIEKPQ